MTTHSEREAFEDRAKGWVGMRLDRHWYGPSSGQYIDQDTQFAFEVWKAARVDLPPHPTEVGEAAATVGRHWTGGAIGFELNDVREPLPEYGTPLFTHPAPAAADGDRVLSLKDAVDILKRCFTNGKVKRSHSDALSDMHKASRLATANSANEYQQALEEAAMLTEAVTITGRTPKELLNDIICYHVANIAEGKVVEKYDDVLVPFLALMRKELHANAGKGDRPGWLSMDCKTALLEIFYHQAKLQKAVKDSDLDGVREYSADVANMSMMLADICGALNATASTSRGSLG